MHPLTDYPTLLPMLLFGFLASYIDGALGMGFGVTASSLILTLGLTPAVISASIHTAKIATALFAGLAHWQYGNIQKTIALPLILPGILGGITGAALLTRIPSATATPIIALFLLLGLIIFTRYLTRKTVLIRETPIDKRHLTLLGFAAAFCDAAAGGGWGPIATPSLVMTHKSDPRKIIGSVNASEFFIAVAQTATFLLLLGPAALNWAWVITLLIGGALAAPLAAYTCKLFPPRLMGLLIGITLITANLLTLINITGILS